MAMKTKAKSAPTIGTYVTKGYPHDGVTGTEAPKRLDETKGGITPLPVEFKKPLTKIVKDTVSKKERGDGMPPSKKTFR